MELKEGNKQLERLQKVISNAGIASRRKAEELILEGKVKVNGKIVKKLGVKVDPKKDQIFVNGKKLKISQNKIYILFYKPKMSISSTTDPEGRKTVLDFFPDIKERIYPVGRLDYDAEGALLLTNDGKLTEKLIHPKYKVPKEYLVKIKGNITEETIEKLLKGIRLEDGIAKVDRLKKIKVLKLNCWVFIKLTEGKNREIKRMMLAVKHPVLRIKRIRFAGISIGKLKPGQYRYLSEGEIERLKKF